MNTPLNEVRILLVEDSPTDTFLIREALFEVRDFVSVLHHAERLSEGIDHFRAEPVDVALLDLGLPDSQGLDTFSRLHAEKPGVPIIVLTGLDDLSAGLQAIQEGAQDYLLKKDIQPALLGRAIRYAIERHHVSVALAESEERFQLAVSGAAAGLWDWNLLTGTMYLSAHFHEIMGYDDRELPNDARTHLDAIHPDDIDRVKSILDRHLLRERTYDVEYRVRTKSGAFRWIQSRGQALWDSAGEPYRMVGWIMDISDRRRAEEQLRESREELKRLSAGILRAREEEKARIARELHDDLGQQLTALKMVTAVLENKLKGAEAGSPEAMVGNLYSMIDQIVVSVRRIAADLRPRMLDDLGLVPAVDWLIADFSSRYGIHVVRSIDANQIAFNRESATAVFRMVQEALTNSARHSGATEVTIGISRDEPNCIVTIADNGQGAESDVRPGLKSFGLLGMRERAERVGGELRIETAPGHGFTVKIVMPLAAVEADDHD
ncbi:histidine kinase [Burkholderia stabilis]|uniref:PAS domain-containing protein n=1 Tax=Burkholderia stabilis TaxID=95485 RepID=UPI0008518B1A|nr:PAS domain-containing protein [Burkholderia stabilis]AOR73174.1 histidine kinase [Burkholderia stabilis]HDR9494607.1 PAS domain-containing protein [Burkholderia stabilis]HDR9524323.1 PAS domain-containing protein [Burkholderia stabilis]HDR9541480.1 PAS domain-containing protein [Burkholderia stabilis]HDR9571296.1 PAS domain-containing protein [Burkholderia stabilis]